MKLRTVLACLSLTFLPLSACQSSTPQANSTATEIQAKVIPTESPMPVFQTKGLAIKGIDPVAYFTDGQALKGSATYQLQWSGATWQFSSAENRELFAANPEQYAPQYGGYCAWAVSQGYVAPIDPEAWAIVDNKLYLNVNRKIQKRWEKDVYNHISKADQNWPAAALNN